MLTELAIVGALHIGAMVSPGPDLAIVMSNALSGRLRNIVAVAIGYATASAIHVILVTSGLWLVVVNNDALANYLVFFGAGFSILVGVLFLKQTDSFDYSATGSRAAGTRSVRTAWSFTQAVIANLSNIRAVIYFIAVFSQLVDAETSNEVKAGWVLYIFVISLVGTLAIGLGLRRLGGVVTSERTQRLLRAVVGGSLIVLGLVLLATNVRGF
jgi:threonine/homoserine/homoserine lactone efflux protein